MKVIKIFLLSAALLIGATSAHAANINLTYTGIDGVTFGGVLFDNAGAIPLVDGSAVWIGSFAPGFTNAMAAAAGSAGDFALMAANFGVYDSLGVFTAGQIMSTATTNLALGSGAFTANNAAVPDAAGTLPALYVWAFNNPVPSLATQWGIFQGPNLANGIAPLGITQSVDFSADTVTMVFGTSFSGGHGTVGLIPEPSTYALMIGVAALGLVYWRKSRQVSDEEPED